MSTDPGSATPGPRQELLREVLQSNQRLTGKAAPAPVAPSRGSTSRGRSQWRWLLAVPLVAAAVAFAAWERPVTHLATDVAPLPAATPSAPDVVTQNEAAPAAPRPPFANPDDTLAATEAPAILPPPASDFAMPPIAELATAPPAWRGPARHAASTRVALDSDDFPDSTPDDLAIYTGPSPAQGLTLKEIFGLGVRTVVIDPGHGGRDPGTSGKFGTFEKDVTLDVALRLKALLEHDHSFRVVLTRDGDTTTPLNRRVELANDASVDLFVSIHVNYLPNSTLNVVETYYFGAHSDPDALRLAERENHGSEYSLSDFESLVRMMRDKIKLQESKRLATAIQSSLTGNMQRASQDLHDVGIKTAPFVVLLGVKAPAVLAEIACMCNPDAEQRLRTPAHREEVARYLAEGIVNYLQEESIKGDESNDRQRQAKKS